MNIQRYLSRDSGFGVVGRAVASDNKILKLESCHGQISFSINCIKNRIEKININKKRGRERPNFC